MKTKFVALLVIMCICILSFGAVPVFAASSGTCGANVTWTLDNYGKLTIKGTGAMTNYEIISNVPWYSSRSNIKTVVINSGVTTICDYAFLSCTKLSSVTIPGSVTSIGSNAFYDCDGLTSISLPNSVTSIGNNAFHHCSRLTKVTIPDSVTSIGSNAFLWCTGLTSITIPDSVTSIGYSAFDNTGYYNNNENWKNNVLYIGKHLIKANEAISGNYTIKEGCLNIANCAFWNCSSLTGVTIPDSVISIGNQAFDGCDSLTSITIPDSVISIGDYAFSSCNSLASVSLGNSVTSIGDYAFYNCESLTSVIIPNSLTTIGHSAFYRCNSLTDVYYTGSRAAWNEISISSYNDNLTSATIHYNHGHNCSDGDNNHKCDVCGEVLSTCADNDSNHKCDVCGEELSVCADNDNNHKCDVCGEVLSVCADDDSNHKCDVCSEALSTCADNDKNHNCDICKNVLSVCADNDKDKKCDICRESTIEIISSGSCGTSATWALDNYGVLTISGSGSMTNFSSTSNIPWYSSRSEISEIIIGDGITHIGNKSFYNCISARKITIPDSVISIGTYAFYNCDKITIYAYAGAYAAWYAKENGIPFVSTGKTELENMTVDVAENEQKWYFDVSIGTYITDAKVYAAVYDEKGAMLSVNSVDLEPEDVTTVSLTKQSDADYVKLFVWAPDFNPVAFSETIDV